MDGHAVPLTVGIPRETKDSEHRVALTPDGASELVHHGVKVLVQAGAGAGASIPDDAFVAAGADLVASAEEVWERAELVCKVKEPQSDELAYLRDDLVLFTYLHLAAYPAVADALVARGTTAIAYETVQAADGSLPLLAPMSEIAGRMATQVAAHYLERHAGGRGVLLGGATGVRPARVVVLGAGHVGLNAARVAEGMGAEVWLLDRDLARLRTIDAQRHRLVTVASNRGAIERAVTDADVIIGAVLVPGDRAPRLVSAEMVTAMRPGSVVIDVAVDQGGCIETVHETTHRDPVYTTKGVLHYGVGNMPGAVPHTSTYALTNATLPYLLSLATQGVRGAVGADAALESGVNTIDRHVVNPAVAHALGMPQDNRDELLDELLRG